MQNITKAAPRGNMTGNRSIAIASTDEIREIKLSSSYSKVVYFNRDHSFGKIESNEIQFNCREEDGHYIHEISCRLVSTQGRHDILFNRMKAKKWIVRVIDNNNISWLAGSLAEPLHFRWEHIAEDKASGQHCYELFFNRASTEPLYNTNIYFKYNGDTVEEVTAENPVYDR